MEDLDSQNYNVNLGIPDFKNIAAWATFTAIIDIISGALACLGIITAAYGVPQIIAGIRLLNAADNLKSYLAVNDSQKITESFYNLNKYFKLNGISIIVKLCIGVLLLLIYIAVIVYIISNAPGIMNELPRRRF